VVGVAVGVGVGVGTIAPNSKAPISQSLYPGAGRAAPRWSMAGQLSVRGTAAMA
jgi:hypothetical protein